MKACLLVLEGGGDLAVTVVSEEVFAWICRPDMPGRSGDESGWLDTAAPKEIVEAHQRAGDDGVYVTIGSYENDRAMAAMSTADDIEGVIPQSFDSVVDAMKWMKENDVEVVNEYHGCIY